MTAALADICRRTGRDLMLVQGPGGNVSVKVAGRMHIKASGTLLKDVTAKKGHVAMDAGAVAAWIGQLPVEPAWSAQLESEYLRTLRENRVSGDAMPSLETGFHSYLSRSVVHTHPLALNALLCSRDGPALLAGLYPDAIMVPYATIGVVLSRAIQHSGACADDGRPIFLINHGLITHGDKLEDAYGETARIARELAEAVGAPPALEISRSDAVEGIFAAGLERLLDRHFFPDSVVYCRGGYSYGCSAEGKIALYPDGRIDASQARSPGHALEISHANAFIALAAQRFGGLTYLPDREVEIISTMESEKYRQEVL